VLFYTRGEQKQPVQLIHAVGRYHVTLQLEQATADPIGLFPRLWRRGPTVLSFERELRSYDAKAFNNPTLSMYAKDWRSTRSEVTR
jgi:hypothetical protein